MLVLPWQRNCWDRRGICNYDDLKAKEIGMMNTNFSNSSGINDPDNYSTVKI